MQDLNEAQTQMIAALMWVSSLDIVRYCTLWNMTFNRGMGKSLLYRHSLMSGFFVNAGLQSFLKGFLSTKGLLLVIAVWFLMLWETSCTPVYTPVKVMVKVPIYCQPAQSP